MSTFFELQQKLSVTKQRKAILEYVLEHLSGEFQPVAGKEPKKTLLTEEKSPVTQEALESELQFITEDIEGLNQEISQILAATLVTAAPVAAPEPVPEPQAAPKKSKKKTPPEQGTTPEN